MNQSIQKKSKQRKDAIQSFKKKINAKRSIADKMADWLTASFGTLLFLGANAIFFTAQTIAKHTLKQIKRVNNVQTL
jgi:uncharacterized membrane protein